MTEYEQLYAQYMDENPMPVKAFKIFDFDGNGVPELWFRASVESSEGPDWATERWSYFCAIDNGVVVELLTGYICGGSAGGDEICFRYDTETQTLVVCLSGVAGGFGGIGSWLNAYSYTDGELSGIARLDFVSQVEDNYINGELDDPDFYYDDTNITVGGKPTFITYYVNDAQVKREIYEQAINRFTDPVNDDLKQYWGDKSVDNSGK